MLFYEMYEVKSVFKRFLDMFCYVSNVYNIFDDYVI